MEDWFYTSVILNTEIPWPHVIEIYARNTARPAVNLYKIFVQYIIQYRQYN